MALSRVKTWAQEKLTYQDLNAEFDNIINNATSLVSPATADWDMNGNNLILDADGDTSIVNSTDDAIKFNIGGAEEYSFTATIFDVNGNKIDLDADADSSIQVSTDDILDVELQGATLFRFNGSTASSVNGIDFQASATTADVVMQAYGTDANIDIAVAAKGTGGVVLTGDVTASNDVTVTNDLTVTNNATVTVDLTVSGDILVDADIVHTGDTDNKIVFTTDTQDFQTGASSRMDITDSGVRLGGANARVTTVLDEDTLSSDSATALATQQSIKAYVDAYSSVSIAIYADLKADTTAGGGFTSGAWQTRDLTTEEFDPDSVASLSANAITLTAGEWLIYGSAPAYQVNDHQVRIYDVTGGVNLQSGTVARTSSGGDSVTTSEVWAFKSVATTNVIRLEHRCETTKATNGYGVPCGFGDAEVYAFVVCVKYA